MYCQRTNVPLQLDHVVPRSKGGSVWPSNFVSACEQCNQEKGGQPLEVYLQDRPALLAQIQAHVKAPLVVRRLWAVRLLSAFQFSTFIPCSFRRLAGNGDRCA